MQDLSQGRGYRHLLAAAEGPAGQVLDNPKNEKRLVGMSIAMAGLGAISLAISIIAIVIAANPSAGDRPVMPGPRGPPGTDSSQRACCPDFTVLTCSWYCLGGQTHVLNQTIELDPRASGSNRLLIEGGNTTILIASDFPNTTAISLRGTFYDERVQEAYSVTIRDLDVDLEDAPGTLANFLLMDGKFLKITLETIAIHEFPNVTTRGIKMVDVNHVSSAERNTQSGGPLISNCNFYNSPLRRPSMLTHVSPAFSDDNYGLRWGVAVELMGRSDYTIFRNDFFADIHVGPWIDGARDTMLDGCRFLRIMSVKFSTLDDERGSLYYHLPVTNTPAPSSPSPGTSKITNSYFDGCGGPCIGYGPGGAPVSGFGPRLVITGNTFINVYSSMLRHNTLSNMRNAMEVHSNAIQPGVVQSSGPYADWPFVGATTRCAVSLYPTATPTRNHHYTNNLVASSTWFCGSAGVPEDSTFHGNHFAKFSLTETESLWGEGNSAAVSFLPNPVNTDNFFLPITTV